jgi:CO dehydrogenase/acetyl-CoA synthase alpha subunit
MPEDLYLYVRRKADIPITMRDEILNILEKKGWQEREIPDPTLLKRMLRKRED